MQHVSMDGNAASRTEQKGVVPFVSLTPLMEAGFTLGDVASTSGFAAVEGCILQITVWPYVCPSAIVQARVYHGHLNDRRERNTAVLCMQRLAQRLEPSL